MANAAIEERRKRNHSPAIEQRRRRNHSPAIERRRAENAWHTNALAPIPAKALRHQAMSLMRTLYKPGFSQLSNEEKRIKSISEKRKSDNAYYLNWLTKQSDLLNASDEAARAQVNAAGQQVQQEVQKGWEAVSPAIEQDVNTQPGTVPQTQSGDSSLLQAAAQAGANTVAEARQETNDQLGTLQTGGQIGRAANFAEIAAMEAKRQSDQNENLTSIRNSRQELRQNRAAEASKRYAEGLDKEIEKAQARSQIAASEATAAIEAKRFGLDAQKANLEASEFNFEKGYKNRKLGFEKLSQKQKHEIEAGNLTVAEAEAQNRKEYNKTQKEKVEKEPPKGTRTAGEKSKAERKTAHQKSADQHQHQYCE